MDLHSCLRLTGTLTLMSSAYHTTWGCCKDKMGGGNIRLPIYPSNAFLSRPFSSDLRGHSCFFFPHFVFTTTLQNRARLRQKDWPCWMAQQGEWQSGDLKPDLPPLNSEVHEHSMWN